MSEANEALPTVEEKNRIMEGTLYLVATPIGNLSDLSARAVKVLSEVDFIAAEDTRNTKRLLQYLGIRKELVSYHEHNKMQRGPELISRLLAQESCALVTDAGMPAISDPGEDLVRLAAQAGVTVTVIPGACAAISALAVSALPTGKFVFEGFLPAVKGERKKRLTALKPETRTLIFYEAPHKLRATLADLALVFGERQMALCRELTKKNEEILRMSTADAVAYYQEKEPRGEYVLIVEGTRETNAPSDNHDLSSLPPREHIALYLGKGFSRMDAMKAAAKDRGMTKSAFYSLLCEEDRD